MRTELCLMLSKVKSVKASVLFDIEDDVSIINVVVVVVGCMLFVAKDQVGIVVVVTAVEDASILFILAGDTTSSIILFLTLTPQRLISITPTSQHLIYYFDPIQEVSLSI